MNKKTSRNLIMWSARITGTLLIIFTLFIGIGEFLDSHGRHHGPVLSMYSPITWTIFFVWGIALAFLIMAIWKEGLGGIISFACFMLMYVLNLFNKDATKPEDDILVFLIFSIPSILYLIYWKLKHDDLKKSQAA